MLFRSSIILPSVMLNLLGEDGYHGPVKIEGLEASMAIPGVKIHIYGKKNTSPNRKMGHVTVIDTTIEGAARKATEVSKVLKIKSWK